jgi:hypothetical protein
MTVLDYALVGFIVLVVIVGVGGFILANRDDD